MRRTASVCTYVLAGLVAAFAPAAWSAPAEPILLDFEPVRDQLHYDVGAAPLSVLLSRSSYPAEDGHVDAIVWLQGEEGQAPAGALRVTLLDEQGARVQSPLLEAIPAPQVFLSVRFPPSFAGRKGSLEVAWLVESRQKAVVTAEFSVRPGMDTAVSGRIRLTISNASGARLSGLPVTLGVPFPRGALFEPEHTRLVDDAGREVALQTGVTARWSRFGSIRWLQCDFACAVAGVAKELYLEYGPDVSRPRQRSLAVDSSARGFPRIDAGRLRLGENGLAFDANGSGDHRQVLGPAAFLGGFVEHESGESFGMSDDSDYTIEERGSVKATILKKGWYRNASGERFCQYVTRYVVFRDSPVVRIFNTWVFTGDGNSDRIRDMGWRFPLAAPYEPTGFLTSFGPDASWEAGSYLLQHDYDKFEIASGERQPVTGTRAPGAFGASVGGARVFIGVRDFWQNFPRELEYREQALVFHEWPRHGKARSHEITSANKLRLWFCHEGELLDFRLPEVYTRPPIFTGLRHETYWRENMPEDVNAQGVAKTSELWVVVAGQDTSLADAALVLEGLENETLRAVVDPEWLTASGVFGDIRQRDVETFPEEERVYELHALAPMVWAERTPVYGKWIWGNMLWSPSLFTGDGGMYRAFRKAHQGWPYAWTPFARSGDVRFLGFAAAATRTMTDVCFCHYSDEKTDHRRRGQWYRGGLPWVGSNRGRPGRPFVPVLRGYSEEVEYMWRCFYLTGYRRARDIIEDWSQLVKDDVERTGRLVLQPGTPVGRRNTNLLKTYLDMYRETFDPWFLAAAHQIARGPDRAHLQHFWKPGNREFQRFTGSEEFTRWYVDEYARRWTAQRDLYTTGAWADVCPQIESAAHAYLLTGEEYFLRRVAGWLNFTNCATYDGTPEFMRGYLVKLYDPVCGPSYTAYYLRQLPYALYALHKSGTRPAPLPSAFHQLPAEFAKIPDSKLYEWRMPTIAVRKEADRDIPLSLRLNRSKYVKTPFEYAVTGPDGTVLLEGTGAANEETTVMIPADAPVGAYRVSVTNRLSYTASSSSKLIFERSLPGLWLPISPAGVPEVLEFEGDCVGRAYWKSQYWLHVPDDVAEFSLEFPLPGGASARDWAPLYRISILDPDGNVAWRHQNCFVDYEGPASITATVQVRPEHRGKMWQVALPGRSLGFRLDPRLPRMLATSPDRWFAPTAE